MRNAAAVFTLLAGAVILPSASQARDPDGRVARVSYVSGDVSYQRGDVEGWNDLRVNTPLVTGDSFWAPDGGRAEVDLGNGTVIRLDGGTEVHLVNNTAEVAQLGLTSGFLDIRARSFSADFTLEIDTPSAAVTILEPGRYRVEVTDRMTTYAAVEGSMVLAVDGEQLDVYEGESLEFENTDPPSYAYAEISGGTPFVGWADGRDSRFATSASARYVHADVVGYEDLDDHGSWRDDREYGRVWAPSGMSQGWAPYQSGRWIWQDPYGWTWVSSESWGWAPYHYGRWVWSDRSWCWVPPPPRGYRGPSVVMNIGAAYAPALVAFVGGKNWGLSLSIGGPAIGWVPLAPAERYYYPWQTAPRVTNNYTNITVNNAVTIVNYNTFGRDSVRPIRVERTQVERAPVIGLTAVGVVPVRESLVVSTGGSPAVRTGRRERTERPLVARLVPPPKPQPFAQKVAQIERTGRPVAAPVATEGTVGKPFARGVRAPAGVRAFSAPAPDARKALKPRRDAEVRIPKKIERDITPPAPAAARERKQRERAPAAAPDRKEQDKDARETRRSPERRETPSVPVTRPVAPVPVTPEAAQARPIRREPEEPTARREADVRTGRDNERATGRQSPRAPAAKAVSPPPVEPDPTQAKKRQGEPDKPKALREEDVRTERKAEADADRARRSAPVVKAAAPVKVEAKRTKAVPKKKKKSKDDKEEEPPPATSGEGEK